jgi:hypothetical protein
MGRQCRLCFFAVDFFAADFFFDACVVVDDFDAAGT